MEPEYEIEVCIRRYARSRFGDLHRPDEVEVLHQTKIFNPDFSSVYDMLDSFKDDAYDKVQEDVTLQSVAQYDDDDLREMGVRPRRKNAHE